MSLERRAAIVEARLKQRFLGRITTGGTRLLSSAVGVDRGSLPNSHTLRVERTGG